MSKKPHDMDESGLVPLHLNDGATASIVSETMFMLNMISGENAVTQYTRTQPEAHRAILALSRSVAEAGRRAREANPKVNPVLQDMRQFTAQEIWVIDLAIDVVAMFAGSGGLRSETAGMLRSRLKTLDEQVHSHHWQHELRTAGNGPEAFSELRAHIPRHKPRG